MRVPGLGSKPIAQSEYSRRVGLALDAAFMEPYETSRDIESLKVVVFSDHHRGNGDRADDFARCESAYNAALGWYLEQGFELWLLGDVEELWESDPGKIFERYKTTIRLEREFADGPGMLRFFGNHDYFWAHEQNVAKWLRPIVGPNAPVIETARIELTDGADWLGTIQVAHGHQGTPDSSNAVARAVSRFAVRHGWAMLQRFVGFASTAPSRHFQLREKHDRAMFDWASGYRADGNRIPMLIAGHTHRPVFPGADPPDLEELARLRAQELADARAANAGAAVIAAARAAAELAAAELERSDPAPAQPDNPPCYFNTGCCSFADGDVTCLELTSDATRLVRWPENDGAALPRELATRPTRSLFADLHGPPGAGDAAS